MGPITPDPNAQYEEAIRAESGALRSRMVALQQAILDIDSHAVALGETEDGWSAIGYYIPLGPLHRALGVVGHSASKSVVVPPESLVVLLRRAIQRTDATKIYGADDV